MRSWTAAEEAAYTTNSPQLFAKVEVRDSSGTLREWTNLDGNGRNIVRSLTWGDSLANGGMDGELVFDWRPAEHDNLSPFWGSGRFSTYLDVVRDVVVSVKVTPPGADPSAFTWREVFRASVDDVDLSGEVGVLPLRDLIYAELMDGFITANKRYGSNAGTAYVDEVAEAILATYDKQGNTLNVPVASTLSVKPYVQQKMPIFRALQDLYFQTGWDLRPLWNGTEFELTAYNPDRTPSGASHTFPASHILRFPQFSISAANIRNWVKVYFGVEAQIDAYGNDTRTFIERLDETSPANDPTGSVVANSSIDKYKWRFMSFAEGATSLIRTEADAGQFADYAILDLANPTFLGSVELAYLFWPVEVNDYYEFEADGLRFASNQDFAVTSFRHSIDFSAGKHSTSFTLQGKPSVGKEQYFKRSSGPGAAPPVDDVAPEAPTVTLKQTPLGVTAVVDVTGALDYDQVLFFVGPVSGFTPSADNLVQASRSREYYHVPKSGQVREWLKVRLRDRTGNISNTSAPLALVAKKTDGAQLAQPYQAKTQLGFYADTALAGYGVVKFNRYQAGEFLGDYNLATGRFFAREGGTYRVAMSGKLSTSMAEGTDFYLCVMRDPDGDDEEVARTTVQTGASGDIAFNLEGFIPLDQDDEFQIEVCDPGGGSFSAITFRATYTTLKVELVGTQTRSAPYPFVDADPEFIDHGPSGTFSATAAACNAVFRCRNGEVLFTNGSAGAEHPAMLHRNVVDSTKAREIEVSGSTDYHFQGVAEDEDRNIYLAASKVDATAAYSVRRYGQDLVQDWVSTDLGSTITPKCLAYAPSTDAPRVYLGTTEPSLVGKVRSINKDSGAAIATSSDLGGPVNSLARMHPDADGGGLIVAQLASATAPDIVALDAGDVTASEIWRIELNGLATPGTSSNRGELKSSPQYDRVYMIGGQDNPTLYAVNAAGAIVWSVDVGDDSALDDVTGCLSIDVHPTTGDIAVLVVYDNASFSTSDLDCVVYDPDGNARWSWRGLYDVDPADDPVWTSSEVGHRIAFATDGAIWVSDGGTSSIAKALRPYSEIPENPPSVLASELLADFDAESLGLVDGAAISVWPSKRGTGAWRLENETAAEQPKMRGKWDSATVDSVDRVRTEFAAVEFDGTERLIGNLESATLQDGAICVLVCEPVDATGDYLSAYADAGSAASPSLELVNDGDRLTLNINVDVADDTAYDAPARSGLQVVGVRASDHTTAGLWLSNAKPNQTEAISGTDASPDTAPRVRLGQAGSSSGDWFAGWVYRWIWVRPAQFSASKVCSLVHWARHYYRIPEVTTEEVVESAFKMAAGATSINPTTEAGDANAIVWIARQSYYPGVRDYCDLVTDDAFTDGLTLPADRTTRPIYAADARNRAQWDGVTTDASLQITGALTLRCGVLCASAVTVNNALIAFGGTFGTETEAHNQLYRIEATTLSSTSRCAFYSENGAGTDNDAEFEIPMGRWIVGTAYIVEARRSSGGVVSMWVNGQQLAWVRSSTGVTDNGDGTVSNFDASGGTSGDLKLFDDSNPDELAPFFWAVYDTEKTDGAAWAEARIADTLQAYQPSSSLHATLAAEADTILCLSAANGTVADLTGNLTGWTAGRTPTAQELIVGSSWLVGDAQGSTADPEFQELSDLVIRVKCRVGNSSPDANDIVVTCGANGETLASNTVWQIGWTDSNTIYYFHEAGAGANHIAYFDVPSALAYGQLLYIVVRRTDNGNGTCTVEMWMQQDPSGTFQQLNLDTTSGTDNGDDTATLTNPAGGTTAVLGVFNFPDLSQEWENAMLDVLHVKAVTTTDAAENAIAALLMPTS